MKANRLFLAEFNSQIHELESTGQRRVLKMSAGKDFSGNDYLQMARNPKLLRFVSDWLSTHKQMGSTGSRLLSGHSVFHEEAESAICQWKRCESALIMNSGYDANTGLIQSLFNRDTIFFSDRLNHASIIDGIMAGGFLMHRFHHQDFNDLEDKLKKSVNEPGKKVVVVESVYSMDGTVTRFSELVRLCDFFGAALIVDEAHGTGVFGNTGAGVLDHQSLMNEPLITMHTGGKALGVHGAFITCPDVVKQVLINKCRSFIYSTAIPPVMVAALQKSIELVKTMVEERHHLHQLSAYCREELSRTGFPSGSESMIIPVIVGDNQKAVEMARALQEIGFDIRAIRPPTVPTGTARLRLNLHTGMTRSDVDAVVQALSSISGAVG